MNANERELKKQNPVRKQPSVGAEELGRRAEAWAERTFAGDEGSPGEGQPWAAVRAVVVQTEDREDDRSSKGVKRRLARNAAVRAAIAGTMERVRAGDLEAARVAIRALGQEDLPAVYWCETVDELAPVLAECLDHGEQCFDSGPEAGPAGAVVWMFVWYDPSHPV